VAAVLAFTNVANVWTERFIGGPGPGAVRSTLLAWLGELASPPPSAYAAASTWLTRNLPPGSNVFSLPDFSLYPLMFHAPQHHYMWQFSLQQRASYPMLQPFNFRFLEIPGLPWVSRQGPAQGWSGSSSGWVSTTKAVDLGAAGPGPPTGPSCSGTGSACCRPAESTWIFRRVQR
jgi:hypothetical protein